MADAETSEGHVREGWESSPTAFIVLRRFSADQTERKYLPIRARQRTEHMPPKAHSVL